MGIDDKIQQVKEKLDKTPVNKATEKERARLKSRIAELEEEKEQRQKGTGGGDSGYAVEKTGDATVALVGYPSVGKSTLLNAVTNAESEVGDYEFTTLDVVPGMARINGANIQIMDVPGLIGGAAQGRGDGKQVLSVVRNADLVLMMTTPDKLDGFAKMADELYDAGIRLDTEPPKVTITKTDHGGLDVKTPADQTQLDMDTITEVLQDRGYVNASIVLREDVDIDRLIDATADNRRYIPSMKAINKIDTVSNTEQQELRDAYPDAVFISAENGTNLERLQQRIYDELELMRIYMKKPGKEADREEPLIVQRGSTIRDVCETLPGDMDETFESARIWGDSADFPEQRVGEDHVLQDEDVVELHTR
jgi:ribosome-interacting GTPase 1